MLSVLRKELECKVQKLKHEKVGGHAAEDQEQIQTSSWWINHPGSVHTKFYSCDSLIIGSFSIDDSNGRENVTFKMNSRFFNLCRVYSNLLKMASVGEFPWSWFLEDRTQV